MKYVLFYIALFTILISTTLLKKLKNNSLKSSAKNMRFKQDGEDSGDEEQHSSSMDNMPKGMVLPEHRPDIPDEMPDYLEKELDMLKENDNYGVRIIK